MGLKSHYVGSYWLCATAWEGGSVRLASREDGPSQVSVKLAAERRLLNFPNRSCIGRDSARDILQQTVDRDLATIYYLLGPLDRLDQVVGEQAVPVANGLPGLLIRRRGSEHEPPLAGVKHNVFSRMARVI